MTIINCTPPDVTQILELYQAARNLQIQRQMVVWPTFEAAFIEREIAQHRQWKLVIEGQIACNWAITFEDLEIWGALDQHDAIYIHRICNNPLFRGKRYIDQIVSWAAPYATAQQKRYVRLDTLGNNTKLIAHYTSAGFRFLGMERLTDTATLPQHYQDEPNCCRFEIDLLAG